MYIIEDVFVIWINSKSTMTMHQTLEPKIRFNEITVVSTLLIFTVFIPK